MRRAAVSVAALVCALGAAGARGADGTSADTAPAEQPPLTLHIRQCFYPLTGEVHYDYHATRRTLSSRRLQAVQFFR